MTAISNLISILKQGLLSHNVAHSLNLVTQDISDLEVQALRTSKRDTIYNRLLHDYVPLYFSPKNPMLYRRKNMQNSMVILGINQSLLLKKETIFTDGNAASRNTKFYQGVAMLDNLNWNIINTPKWFEFSDGKRIKCAEVLVYPEVKLQDILVVFCYSNSQFLTVNNVVRTSETLLRYTSIQVKQELFFTRDFND